MNVLILPNNVFLSKRERTSTFGTVEMKIAFSILLQCMSGKNIDGRSQCMNSPNQLKLLVNLVLTINIGFLNRTVDLG